MTRNVRVWIIWHDDPAKDPREYTSSHEPHVDTARALVAQGYKIGFVTVFLPSPLVGIAQELGRLRRSADDRGQGLMFQVAAPIIHEPFSRSAWGGVDWHLCGSEPSRVLVTEILSAVAVGVGKGIRSDVLEFEWRALDSRLIPPQPKDPNAPWTLYLERRRVVGFMPGDARDDQPVHVYVHRFQRGDEDPTLHNHPWEWAVSLVLRGAYVEERRDASGVVCHSRVAGSVHSFERDTFHRITSVHDDCWTLFVAGPKTSGWGYDVPGRGFIPWRDRLHERGVVVAY